ncbi:Integrator complex subunit 6 [Irineochytrium annulatum]|nr:Integrator complex subunit 6 [Irineochytrium annulatum]
MHYVFIIDTSGSMNQIFSNQMTYLDCAKYGVEHFFKAGVNDSPKELLEQLKALRAYDLSNAGGALNAAFDYLNLYRHHVGLEKIAQGRLIGDNEPTVLMWFTDGTSFSTVDRGGFAITDKLLVPGLRTPGCQNYVQPFRWDQKLLTFVMDPEGVPTNAEIGMMSAEVSGEVFAVNSVLNMQRCIDNCMGAVKPPHPGVHPQLPVAVTCPLAVDMEELPIVEGQPPSRKFKVRLYPNRDEGKTYPIPEAFWPLPDQQTLPSRVAHPHICFVPQDTGTLTIPKDFPFDRVHVDVSNWPALQAQKPNTVWPLYVRGSNHRETNRQDADRGHPFGFLKVSSAARGGVNMYILPYNFPRLFKIIDRPLKNPDYRSKLPLEFRNLLKAYFDDIPAYYHLPVKAQLDKLGFPQATTASCITNMPSWPIMRTLANQKDHATSEFNRSRSAATEKRLASEDVIRRSGAKEATTGSPIALPENPFDVSRENLISTVMALQKAVAEATSSHSTLTADDEDKAHSLPVSEMGVYHVKSANQMKQQLRNPLETDEEITSRQNRDPFGNPWTNRARPGAGAGGQSSAAGPEDSDEASEEAQMLASNPALIAESPPGSPRQSAKRKRSRSASVSSVGSASSAAASVGRAASRLMRLKLEPAISERKLPCLWYPPSDLTFEDVFFGRKDVEVMVKDAIAEYKASVVNTNRIAPVAESVSSIVAEAGDARSSDITVGEDDEEEVASKRARVV